LEDESSRIHKDNVAKFGIPKKYIKEAFAEQTILEASSSGRSLFCLALENEEITGFAQTRKRDARMSELDRIVIFQKHTKKGIDTRLLQRVLAS
jgi:N-acetylglutamate synthase-like GNAT family acetyltransferase